MEESNTNINIIDKYNEKKIEFNTYKRNWWQKNWKFITTFILYILYQSNFLITLISSFGVNVSAIPRNPRVALFAATDSIYIIILIIMFWKDIKRGLKDLKNNFLDRSLLSLNCWIVGCIVMTLSSYLISLIMKQQVSANETLVRQGIKMAPMYMLFSCSIVAPIFEEMVFRKSLRGLIRFKWLFIIVSGFGFGLLHVVGSYSNPLDFLYIIPYGSMGCAFAYLLTKTNNITLPIIIHMLHNTILVIVQIFGG